MRIGVALIQQEANTFAPRPCEWSDFTVRTGSSAAAHTVGTNTEMAGAIAAVAASGHEAVPLIYAWALPSGRVTEAAFNRLREMLVDSLSGAGGLDGIVLALHGSMASESHDDADSALIDAARGAASGLPIGVSLDLHANVTRPMVAAADAILGYRTDPHVDQFATGERAAGQVLGILTGELQPATYLAKRPMIVPAESMNTTTGPLAAIRSRADDVGDAVDISLFPVQPWLDVSNLGFGVVVTTNNDTRRAGEIAEQLADLVWESRDAFRITNLLEPEAAAAASLQSPVRPFVIAESADAPTAGAAGDSPVMVAALLTYADRLTAAVPVADPAAVAVCHAAGPGAEVDLTVGAAVDQRWHAPVPLSGVVRSVGSGSYRLEGVGYSGLEVSMGRFAVVVDRGLSVLLSERPAWSADPATFRFAGIDPDRIDVLVVRSCSDFRPNFPGSAEAAVSLDVSGPATPRLETLEFTRAGRPLWPLDTFDDDR